jgi:septal ring factor EnvC (AmiA/AmiB activator)
LPTLTADTPPAQPKKAPPRQSFHYKVVISLYRVFAITVLYLVLGGILAYAFVMGFYAVSNSWAAPLILSAVDEKSLDFRQKLVTSQQTIEDLKVDSQKLESGIAEMKKHRSALLALEPQLQAAIARERTHNRSIGPQLAALDTQKQADNVKSTRTWRPA